MASHKRSKSNNSPLKMVKDLERTIRPDGKEVLHGIDNLVSWESWDRLGSI